VISKSERFLREHAASPYRAEALFQLAQASEDWWNAEHPVGWPFVPDAKYAPREEEMRRKSSMPMSKLLAAEPQSIGADGLRSGCQVKTQVTHELVPIRRFL